MRPDTVMAATNEATLRMRNLPYCGCLSIAAAVVALAAKIFRRLSPGFLNQCANRAEVGEERGPVTLFIFYYTSYSYR